MCSIRPLDTDTIIESVKKTHRLVRANTLNTNAHTNVVHATAFDVAASLFNQTPLCHGCVQITLELGWPQYGVGSEIIAACVESTCMCRLAV